MLVSTNIVGPTVSLRDAQAGCPGCPPHSRPRALRRPKAVAASHAPGRRQRRRGQQAGSAGRSAADRVLYTHWLRGGWRFAGRALHRASCHSVTSHRWRPARMRARARGACRQPSQPLAARRECVAATHTCPMRSGAAAAGKTTTHPTELLGAARMKTVRSCSVCGAFHLVRLALCAHAREFLHLRQKLANGSKAQRPYLRPNTRPNK
jgi:hypothetical protein